MIVTEKTCNKCGEKQSIEQFHFSGNGRRSNQCKSCKSLYWKQKRQGNPEWAKQRDISRNAKTMGLSLEERYAMYAEQNGRCAICKVEGARFGEGTRSTTLALDHDHKTGEIRHLLCIKCNRGLGLFRDDAALLIRAAEYLKGELDGKN